jgi:hypothetical protein
MKIPATLGRAPAATSKMRNTVATVGSRLIVVFGPPTIVMFPVITGSPSARPQLRTYRPTAQTRQRPVSAPRPEAA